MDDPAVAVTMPSAKRDDYGLYGFVLHRGIRTVDVDMPGLPLAEVRSDTLDAMLPRLYVDGSSWWWGYALDFASEALDDHDGSIAAQLEEDLESEIG